MRISESESHVMDVFWSTDEALSAEDVVAAMANQENWSAGTIRTFLSRLLKKKALAATLDGRRYLYRPLVLREDYIHEQSRKLIDRLFDGRISPLVTQFSERQGLTREEVAELKRLIERLESDL